MNELIAVAVITILAVISPGSDFAMVTRNSYAYGRRSGLMAALGIACGVQVHVFYAVLGIALIIIESPLLFMTMKVLGAGYLIYLGVRSLINSKTLVLDNASGPTPSSWHVFRSGFLTNALNPKTMLFVVATFSQVVQSSNPLTTNFIYGLFMSFFHWAWFSCVALFFSAEALRRNMLAKQHIIDRLIGTALISLGACLILPGFGS